MKPRFKWTAATFIFAVAVAWIVTDTMGQPVPGHPAPAFSLLDLKGTRYDLNIMKDRPMLILYFFDIESQSSREGLKTLEKLASKHSDAELYIWGITRSSKESVSLFVNQTNTHFPILLDSSNISDVYRPRYVLPTICILGPELKVLDFIQGGGKSTEVVLTKLAERQLQRKKDDFGINLGELFKNSEQQQIEIFGYGEPNRSSSANRQIEMMENSELAGVPGEAPALRNGIGNSYKDFENEWSEWIETFNMNNPDDKNVEIYLDGREKSDEVKGSLK